MPNGDGEGTLRTQIEGVIGRTNTALDAVEGWLGVVGDESVPESLDAAIDARLAYHNLPLREGEESNDGKRSMRGFTGKGGEEEDPLMVMQTQLDALQLSIEEKQAAMQGDIEKSLSTSMDNKQDLAQLLLKLTMLSGSIDDLKGSVKLLDARMDALAAAQEVPEHEKPERQAENLI